MRLALRTMVVVGGLWIILGCSGMSDGLREGARQQIEQAEKATKKLPKKEAARVGRLIAKAKEALDDPDADWVGLTKFAVILGAAAEDNKITKDEFKEIEKALDAATD